MSSLSEDEKMESELSSKSRWSEDGWSCLYRTDHSLVSLGSGGWAAEEQAKGIMARSDYRGMRVSVRLLPQKDPNAYSISAGIRVNDLALMQVLAPTDAWQRAGRVPPRNIRCAEVYGTSTTQEQLFEEVNPAIVHAMSGRGTGAVFCFGATGTGKSYTMGGPIEKKPDMGPSDPEAGMLQRSAEHMFKYIDERRNQGHYFNIKAQYLLIEVLPDGDRYMDLLTGQQDIQLKVKRVGSTFTAVGLSDRQITSCSQMIEVYVNARHRIAKLDEDKELEADCCHCLLMLDIESEVEIEGGARVPKFKTKLFFGDLAGCEMFESDSWVTDERKQRSTKIWEQFDSLIEIASELPKGYVLAKPDEEAQGQTLDALPDANSSANIEVIDATGSGNATALVRSAADASALAAVAPTGSAPKRKPKLSTLARLLHDFVRCESTARSVMISTINTEPGKLNDLANTLNFAHQMNYIKVLHKPAGVAPREAIPKTIQQTQSLKEESQRCLEAVRESLSVLDAREDEAAHLRKRLSRKNAEKKEMIADHTRQLRKLGSQMEEMEAQVTALKSKAHEEMTLMKTSLEQQFTQEQGASRKRIQELEIQLESAQMEKAEAQDQVAVLKARNERLEAQLTTQQTTSEQAMSELRHELESQMEKMSGLETENAELKAQLESKAAETNRLTGELARKVEEFTQERFAWSSKETNFLEDLKHITTQLEEAKNLASSAQDEVTAQKSENEVLKEELGKTQQQLQDTTANYADCQATSLELEEMINQLQSFIFGDPNSGEGGEGGEEWEEAAAAAAAAAPAASAAVAAAAVGVEQG